MTRIWLMFALSMLLTSTVVAGPEPTWKAIGGSFIGYVQSNLPKPVVIYVLKKNKGLVGVIATGGSYAQEQVARVQQNIQSGEFLGNSTAGTGLRDQEKRLELYLNDQGYSLSELTDKGPSNVVLLIAWNTADLDCKWLKDATETYKHAVSNSFRALGDRGQGYAFVELKLSTQHVEVSCPEKPVDGPM